MHWFKIIPEYLLFRGPSPVSPLYVPHIAALNHHKDMVFISILQ